MFGGLVMVNEEVYPLTAKAESAFKDIETESKQFNHVAKHILEYIGEAEHGGWGDMNLTEEQVDILVDFAIYYACVVNDERVSD